MRCDARFAVRLLVVLLLCSLALPAAADKEEMVVGKWLLLGPAPHPLPVFGEEERGGYDLAALLEEATLPDLRIRPGDGDELSWFSGPALRWTAQKAGKKGELPLEGQAVAWAVAYISVDRWLSLEMELLGAHPRRAWLDGEPLVSGGTGDEEEELTATVKLTPGDHTLLVKTLFDPEREAKWSIGAAFKEASDDLRLSLDPARRLNLGDILDPPRVTSLAVHPWGAMLALSVTRVVPGTDDTESWFEFRDSSVGKVMSMARGGSNIRSIAFSPDGSYFSYVADAPGSGDKKGSSLYLFEKSTANVTPLLEGIENLGGYLWSPSAKAIVYSTTVKAEKDERGVKLLEGLMDRWATYRDKQFLHMVEVPGGARRRLTAGGLTTEAVAFSADGGRLLFKREVEDFSARPYSRTELWELDIESFEATKLRDFAWFNDAVYSPDGKQILIAASAGAFGEDGIELSSNPLPNSYDVQLFIWDPATDEVEPLTRGFDPSVRNVFWNRNDGNIYITATDQDYVHFYRHDPEEHSFDLIESGFDRVRGVDVAQGAPLAVGLGSSPWAPQTLFAIDLESDDARKLAHSGDSWFEGYRPGTLENWNFIASNGRTIPGRVYLPPDFDASRKYPAIVYYYAGTSPVTREFGGRYPKEWWASNGYVVYVLQPTGATGWGQEASATHVNDWGKVTAQEIIEGTARFLESHPFVDPARVGCIGASYGGFETMLLTTMTDIFAAAVSHAGISSLSSYWGEGYWGYSYSAVATADAFPWNRSDIYVEQSPLFRADKNRVPILLTHGSSDTNVPVGESDAFYVALKLLGKDVEYLQILGQDHWIADHGKREIWSRSILAWFDRWLKEEPEWWNDLYPSDER